MGAKPLAGAVQHKLLEPEVEGFKLYKLLFPKFQKSGHGVEVLGFTGYWGNVTTASLNLFGWVEVQLLNVCRHVEGRGLLPHCALWIQVHESKATSMSCQHYFEFVFLVAYGNWGTWESDWIELNWGNTLASLNISRTWPSPYLALIADSKSWLDSCLNDSCRAFIWAYSIHWHSMEVWKPSLHAKLIMLMIS